MSTQLESLRRYVAHRPPIAFAAPPDRVLLVGGGKGGVGTSTVSALVAVMAAADGLEVLLVDADENHGALPLLCGAEPRHALSRLRGGDVKPADLLVHLGHGLVLLPAGGEVRGERIEPSERRRLLRRLVELYDRFDLVVVDAGSRLEQVRAAAAAGASRLLAVSAAERVAAAATYALVKVLDGEFPELPIDLLFNRCRLANATTAFEEVDGATRSFLRRSLQFAGALPDDERLRSEIDAGTSIQAAAALGSPATAAAHELAVRMADQLARSSIAVIQPRLSSRR